MTKHHKKHDQADQAKSETNRSLINDEVKKRKSLGKKPRTKSRTSPGELHKVQ